MPIRAALALLFAYHHFCRVRRSPAFPRRWRLASPITYQLRELFEP
jgi:hypothetical protein